MFHTMGLGALVVIAGDGTLGIAHQFSTRGIRIVSFDRVLATRFGGKAVELIARTMVALDPPDIVARKLEDVVGKTKTVR
jgi:6-phosphofructokinase